MHREPCHCPEADKDFQSLEHLYGTYLPYQLTTGTETIWSGCTLVRVSCVQYTLSTALCWLPHPHLSQALQRHRYKRFQCRRRCTGRELRAHRCRAYSVRALQPRRSPGPRIHLPSSIARALTALRTTYSSQKHGEKIF